MGRASAAATTLSTEASFSVSREGSLRPKVSLCSPGFINWSSISWNFSSREPAALRVSSPRSDRSFHPVSCFFTEDHKSGGPPPNPEVAAELFATIKQRLADRPEGSYIAKLAARGVERMAQKVGEEATEVVIAGVTGNRESLIAETADLWFHTLILLAESGLSPDDVWAELAKRRR